MQRPVGCAARRLSTAPRRGRAIGLVWRDLEAGQGISIAFLDVLGAWNDEPGRKLRRQERQKRLLSTDSGLTRLIDHIEQAGLVRREPVPDDRRGRASVFLGRLNEERFVPRVIRRWSQP